MRQGFRQALTWLHNWAGLTIGWLLLAIAAAGTLSVFRPELNAWTHPELARATVDQAEAGASAVRWLQGHATKSSSWFIDLADDRMPGTLVYYLNPGEEYSTKLLSPVTGTADGIRDSLGGEFFYRFHFELQLPYPWGRLLAVCAAEMMLVVLISGIVAHRRIFKDFFTLRTGKGQRSWLDGHVILGVLTLPFQLMIALTGVVTLVTLFLPWAGLAAYHGDEAALSKDLYPAYMRPKTDQPALLVPIAPLLRTAAARFDGGGIATMTIANAGDAAQTVTVSAGETPGIAVQQHNITFDGTTGRILHEFVEKRTPMRVHDILYGLHMGRFAGLASRWLYFLSGLMLTAAIATGLVLWTVKHHRPGNFGHALVDRLNMGFIAGMPAAFASFLLANRLLPTAMAGRAGLETRWLFGVWAVFLLIAFVRPVRATWPLLLSLAAALCVAPVLADALTPARDLPGGLRALDGVAIGVDAFLLATAGLLAFAARLMLKAQRRAAA